MTTIAQKEKSLLQILAERDEALLDVKLTLEEFTERVTVKRDDRFARSEWRVQGDVELYYWLFDVYESGDFAIMSDSQVIECAYNRFRAIQQRGGQINFHSVYVKDCEDIELVPRKICTEYATVSVVKDRVDGLYRYATRYSVRNGGGSSGARFGDTSQITKTKTDAILKGARQIVASVENDWQAKEQPEKYSSYLNEIKTYIETLESEIRQPSLFGFL